METKADLLRFAISFALRDVRTDRAKLGLTFEQREKIAEDVVSQLQRSRRWKDLEDSPEPGPLGPDRSTTPGNESAPKKF